MIKINNKELCCGCGACLNVCPKRCITLTEDWEGFRYPTVDDRKCVNCGLCNGVCPLANAMPVRGEKTIFKAGVNPIEKIRMDSSSGGLFWCLALDIINKGGCVFGAAFDESFEVHHIAVQSVDNVYQLMGSKYVQSNIEYTFQDVKKRLNAGQIILYSGTPCQIAGLEQYLCDDYPNLFTVDFVCHGVPSQKVWMKYLQMQNEENGEIKDIAFREKKSGWMNYAMKLNFCNGETYRCDHHDDKYMQIFLSDYCLRPSCYSCRFKSIERVSDITFGDFWSVGKLISEFDDDKGTSLILVHSEKGAHLIDSIRDEFVFKDITREQALSGSGHSIIRSSAKPDDRDKVMCNLDKLSIDQLYKKTRMTLTKRAIRKAKRMLKKG